MRRNHYILNTSIRLIICVVFGFISSVGVAWLAAASVDLKSYWKTQPSHSTGIGFPTWVYHQKIGRTYRVIYSAKTSKTFSPSLTIKNGPWWSRVSQDPELYFTGTVWEEAWGWPMVCMVSERSMNFAVFHSSMEFDSGIPIGPHSLSNPWQKLLPTRPIWNGILVNTTLYAFITWYVLVLCVRLQNVILRKHGYCLICRYNVRDLPVCPECGSNVRTIVNDPIN